MVKYYKNDYIILWRINAMDKLTLAGLKFNACHGVHPFEKTTPQPFELNVNIFFDMTEAGATDDLAATINYSDVYKIVSSIMNDKCYDLIEAIAHNVATSILYAYEKVREVEVEVRKIRPPVKGEYSYMSATVVRRK
jgi:dihydroneopterin aldolase